MSYYSDSSILEREKTNRNIVDKGKVYVSKYNYKTKKWVLPEGVTPIVVQPGKDSKGKLYQYSFLSPYSLKTQEGWILENVWQFSKIYREVPEINTMSYVEGMKGMQPIWKHPKETHITIEDSKISVSPKYWDWREKGYNNTHAVRYPVGFNNRNECLGAYWYKYPDHPYRKYCVDFVLMDYVQARKFIYFGEYKRAIENIPKAKFQIEEFKKGFNKGRVLVLLKWMDLITIPLLHTILHLPGT